MRNVHARCPEHGFVVAKKRAARRPRAYAKCNAEKKKHQAFFMTRETNTQHGLAFSIRAQPAKPSIENVERPQGLRAIDFASHVLVAPCFEERAIHEAGVPYR